MVAWRAWLPNYKLLNFLIYFMKEALNFFSKSVKENIGLNIALINSPYRFV